MNEEAAEMTPLEKAVWSALDAQGVKPEDKATANLAVFYAQEIDDGGDLTKLGPALLACLTALLLTPAARAAAMKGVQGASDKPKSPVDEVRERRERKSRAAHLDATAT